MLEETRTNFTLPTPKRIDRYDVLGKIAEGGMAEIFLAKQSGMEGFEKLVVLKCILPALFDDEEFIEMFLDEARIAAKLNHPNIIQIYDLGRTEDTFYIAMEHVSGRNLQQIIFKEWDQKGLMPIAHACKILAGVSEGLHYAHQKTDIDGSSLSIVHRDVSPQNILISFGGNIKLVDFGIAKAAGQVSQTRAGVLKGKYAYMSPEHVRGESLDGRSDIFSAGIVFYEMLTGRRPFEMDKGADTLRAVLSKKPADPRKYNNKIPKEIMKILARCLEKNPQNRYQSAQELQLDLEDYLASSSQKSSSVHLTRYMETLFDDELKREDAQIHVSGVGNVVLPVAALQGENERELPGPPTMQSGSENVTAQKEIDEDLFSEISRTDVNAIEWESDGSDLEGEGKDYDTMTAFDAKAYQEYVARKHQGEVPDEEPVFISQEAASMISEPILDDIDDGPTEASQFIFGATQSPRMPTEEQAFSPAAVDIDDTNVNRIQNNLEITHTAVQPQGHQTHDTDLNQNLMRSDYRISHRISSIVLAVLVAVAGLTVFVLQQWTQAPTETPQEVVIYGQIRLESEPAGAKVFVNGVEQKKLTPMTDVVLRAQSQDILFQKEGYEDKVLKLQLGAEEAHRRVKVDLIPKKTAPKSDPH